MYWIVTSLYKKLHICIYIYIFFFSNTLWPPHFPLLLLSCLSVSLYSVNVCVLVSQQRVLTGSDSVAWSCSQTLLVCLETEEEGQSDRETDFIETETRLEWRRERQRDVRETETVIYCTETTPESFYIFKTPTDSSTHLCLFRLKKFKFIYVHMYCSAWTVKDMVANTLFFNIIYVQEKSVHTLSK